MNEPWTKMNSGILSLDDQELLSNCRVLLVGCGGIGGYLANHLVRLGLGHLTLVDFDRFETTNLNRQLFSSTMTVEKYKANVLQEELLKVNPLADINTIIDRIENIPETIFFQIDYVLDALDSGPSKIALSRLAQRLGVPLLHGSCGGWYGQFGWIYPNSSVLEEIYETKQPGLEQSLMNPSFAPASVASFMASEFVKMIQHDPTVAHTKLTLIDLKTNAILSIDRRE